MVSPHLKNHLLKPPPLWRRLLRARGWERRSFTGARQRRQRRHKDDNKRQVWKRGLLRTPPLPRLVFPNAAVHPQGRFGAERRSQGPPGVRDRLTGVPPTARSGTRSAREVTHESPPHNSQAATLKLRGPPIFPWNVYKRCISKRLRRTTSKESSDLVLLRPLQKPNVGAG